MKKPIIRSCVRYRYWTRQVCEDVRGTWDHFKFAPFDEGLGLTMLRLCWLPFILWHSLIFAVSVLPVGYAYLFVLGHRRWTGRRRWRRAQIRGLFYLLVDAYIAAWTVAVVTAYVACIGEAQLARVGRPGAWTWPIIWPGFVAVARLYEILSYIGGSYSQPFFKTLSIRRAIFNTAWHYVEAIICFATIYVCISVLWGDTFVAPPDCACTPPEAASRLADHWLGPLYFSTICITTVGFGDFAPQTWAGKAAVMAQVLFGIFLLVIVIGRVLSSQEVIEPSTGSRRRRTIIF